MDITKSDFPDIESDVASMSVADSILLEFFEALDTDVSLEGVGERLRSLILDKRLISEAEIQNAMFADT